MPKRFFSLTSLYAVVAIAGLSAAWSAAAQLPDFTALVERNKDAVVNIATTQRVRAADSEPQRFELPEGLEGHPLGEMFKRFFGEQGIPLPKQWQEDSEQRERFESESLGSGLIISADGYILTNYHVIEAADEVLVRFSNRRQLTAEVIGTDKRSDVALIKVRPDAPLTAARIGRSGDLKVGQWVLAIGSPFGFDYTVTSGIVSALGRNLPSEHYVPFIQTDVAINPGNSGGPLFNLDGEVIGINSQIYSRTGGFMGLSFAIPIDMAMNVVQQLKSDGRVQRGWLGVLVQDVTPELAESFGMQTPQGALIAKVLDDSPADEAGLRVGDVVVDFNGARIPTSASLPPVVSQTPVDMRVAVGVIRDGERKTIKLRIGELPEEAALERRNRRPGASRSNRLGLEVVELTDEIRDQLGLAHDHGVVVSELSPGPAARAGMLAGDVLLRLNNEVIDDVEHFEELIAELPSGKRTVAVLVQRRGGPTFLALKLKE